MKIIYWISTSLLCIMMTVQGVQGFLMTEALAELYNSLGFPSSLVIPLAIAKLLAVVAILSKKVKILKTLAYYGLGLDFVLATGSHIMSSDGLWAFPLVALILLVVSFVYDRKVYS